MKVLAVNKFFYNKGGSETYYFGLNDLLKENGHEVIPFSMKHCSNVKSRYNEYFIENISYENISPVIKIKNTLKIIYSLEAKKKIAQLIYDAKPDIAHLHIFQHQMSPSIIKEIKKHSIPVINTVHDLKVICPNYKMLNKNGICEDCKGNRYYNCIRHSCVKDSKFKSGINVLEAYIHKMLKSYDYVDRFICPSKFYKKKFIEFGIPCEKVVYIPNFIDVKSFTPKYESDNYIIYFGRISEEKGIPTLIKAMAKVRHINLLIVGDGPEKEKLERYKEQEDLKNIIFLGFKSGEELYELIKNSMFTVIPSEWYENAPMAILEAMSMGKPVLGSNIGGITELVEENSTGLLFKPGDFEELADKINRLSDDKNKIIKMGKNARIKMEREFDKELHYEKITNLYNEVFETNRR